jgi:hypothetical protein
MSIEKAGVNNTYYSTYDGLGMIQVGFEGLEVDSAGLDRSLGGPRRGTAAPGGSMVKPFQKKGGFENKSKKEINVL